MSKFVIGVDLGGTKINTGIIDESGKVILSIKVPTLAKEGPYPVIERIKKSIYDVLIEANMKLEDIKGIGIISPGPIDSEKGLVVNPSNLPGWDHIPIVKLLREEFKLPVMLDNDANAAALAEYMFGSGRGLKNFVYITVSTGIGGGVIIDGKLYRGTNSNAGEVGHMTINYNGPKCNCGNFGCFETYASGTAIARFAKKAVLEGRSTLIKELAGEKEINAQHVFEAAIKGDNVALELIDEEAFYLGIGISNIIAFANPERITLGGGVSNQLDMFYNRMMETINERSLKSMVDVCQIVKSELKDDIGILGAAAIII
ncbi:MAG: hypothetical protein K0R09_1805 [Clostridiales bacterium]|jgi:glucokinase|nr:hypothetical protein [Clostridiales bacterium]